MSTYEYIIRLADPSTPSHEILRLLQEFENVCSERARGTPTRLARRMNRALERGVGDAKEYMLGVETRAP